MVSDKEMVNTILERNEALSQNYRHRIGSFISNMMMKPSGHEDEYMDRQMHETMDLSTTPYFNATIDNSTIGDGQSFLHGKASRMRSRESGRYSPGNMTVKTRGQSVTQ